MSTTARAVQALDAHGTFFKIYLLKRFIIPVDERQVPSIAAALLGAIDSTYADLASALPRLNRFRKTAVWV